MEALAPEDKREVEVERDLETPIAEWFKRERCYSESDYRVQMPRHRGM
jgi:hypothetical protein